MEYDQFKILDDENDETRLLCYLIYFYKSYMFLDFFPHSTDMTNSYFSNVISLLSTENNEIRRSHLRYLIKEQSNFSSASNSSYSKVITEFNKDNGVQSFNTESFLREAKNYTDKTIEKYQLLFDLKNNFIMFGLCFIDLKNIYWFKSRNPEETYEFTQIIKQKIALHQNDISLIKLHTTIALIELNLVSQNEVFKEFDAILKSQQYIFLKNNPLDFEEVDFFITFTLNYLKKNYIFVEPIFLEGIKRNLVEDVAFVESLIYLHLKGNFSLELFYNKYKKAVAQKKYRGNDKTKTLNVQISTKTKTKLEELLKHHDKTQPRYIETLINDAYEKMKK